jgi:hypothetical protein
MRLALIEPETGIETGHRQRLTFTCDCGFEYRLSDSAMAEHVR